MGAKSRGNFALGQSLTQEEYDRIFSKKEYSIHTDSCPDDCTFGWGSKDIAEVFNISRDVLEDLCVCDTYSINEFILVMRDK